MIFLIISKPIVILNDNKIFQLLQIILIYSVFSMVYFGLMPAIFKIQEIITIDLALNLNSEINGLILGVFTVFLFFCGFLFYFIPWEFENTRIYDFKSVYLRSIALSLGLGIGWMIYQHFPIVESPPPLLEILKDLLKN